MKQHSLGEELFLRISVHLTGFNRSDLLGTGMLEAYYKKTLNEYVNINEGETLQSFLNESERILDLHDQNEEAIHNAIASSLIPYSQYSLLIHRIITLWYLGNWIINEQTNSSEVLSPQSYTQGLVWNIADSHPPGAKQPGYGSWAVKPFNIHQEIT